MPVSDGERLRTRVESAVGKRYELLEEIGRGGMAVVYRARDVRLRRHVALKVLPPELAFRSEVRQRFLREAQTAAQLSHPNIVPIFSVDEGDGLVWFAMGLVEGESLAARLHRESRPPTAFVRQVLRDVADALEYAHARGVIHRDVKPDNILIDRETGRAMVTDFGIARAAEAGTRLTMTGIAVGTPTYMSPEQAMGERDVDARSDLYSLAVVGYQMLAGEVPFQASTTAAMLMKHVSDRPRPLHEIRPELPENLVTAIERALEKSPERRWSSAREMRDVLDGVMPAAPAQSSGAAAGTNADSGRESPSPEGAPSLRLPARPQPSDPGPTSAPRPRNARTDPADEHEAAAGDGLLPPYPAFPKSTNREAREEWRRQQAEWQREVRNRLAVQHRQSWDMSDPDDYGSGKKKESLERFAARPLEERFSIFRRRAMRSAGTIGLLSFINMITVPFFPWVIFPAWGILGGLSPQWKNLKAEGVTLGNLLDGTLPHGLAGRDRHKQRKALSKAERALRDGTLSKSERRALERASRNAVWWEQFPRLEKRVRSLQRWAGAAVGLPVVVGLIGGMANSGEIIGMGFMAGAFSALIAIVKAVRLRRIGVRLRKVLRPGWRERLKALDPRTEDARLEAEARALVAPEVLDSDQGAIVMQALRERQQVRRAVQIMSDEERAMIPDVLPTADALVERVGALSQALHRLELEMPHDMVRSLDARFAELERAPAAADTERRRALLERQRQTLKELEDRRHQVGGQLDSALLVLQQMKLDLLRLRSAGFQSALTSVTSATQEARALSLDIGRVLDAGEELDDDLQRRRREGAPVAEWEEELEARRREGRAGQDND